MSVFRSAIGGDDGRVDAGYLALFWTMAVTVGVIPIVALVGVYVAYKNPDKAGEILQQTGVAIGAICTGAGVVIGAVGAFRMGDKPHLPTQEPPSRDVNVNVGGGLSKGPVPVQVANPDPIEVTQTPNKKGKR